MVPLSALHFSSSLSERKLRCKGLPKKRGIVAIQRTVQSCCEE